MKLSTMLFAAALALPATLCWSADASAQAAMPAPAAIPEILFASSADVQALIAKAKTMPAKAMIQQPLVSTGISHIFLEYRNGANTGGAVHPVENELIYLIQGSGTLTTGGTMAGGVITGGTSRPIAKGDFFLVPAGTPHQIATNPADPIVLMAFHTPAVAATPAP